MWFSIILVRPSPAALCAMRLTPTLFVLFHYPRGCVTTDNTRDKTFKPSALRQSTLTDAVCTNISVSVLVLVRGTTVDFGNDLQPQIIFGRNERKSSVLTRISYRAHLVEVL